MTDDTIIQFPVPSKTVTETIGDKSVTYTYDQDHKNWRAVIHYTQTVSMVRTATTLEAARKAVTKAIVQLDKTAIDNSA